MNNVQSRINTLSTDLETAETNLSDKDRKLDTAEKDRIAAEGKMASAQGEADIAKRRLSKAETDLVDQRERADGHEANAKKLQEDLVVVREDIASWRLFEQANGTQAQISQKLATFTEVNNQRANFLAENTILLSQIEKIGVELSRYTGTSVKVSLPQNLHGTVTAVDAQFDFVVLDIGESQGAREHGELLVSRGEKLIGKLRILDVKKDHSIANILPDWKQGEIQTGDLVIVGN
jgi:hypothetical protein